MTTYTPQPAPPGTAAQKARRAIYDLGREHGAAAPQPAPPVASVAHDSNA